MLSTLAQKTGAQLGIRTSLRRDGFQRHHFAAAVLRAPDFRFAPKRPGIWHEPYAGWVATRYEDKARAEGRLTSFYFEFERL